MPVSNDIIPLAVQANAITNSKGLLMNIPKMLKSTANAELHIPIKNKICSFL